jgi:hypothetical protein
MIRAINNFTPQDISDLSIVPEYKNRATWKERGEIRDV